MRGQIFLLEDTSKWRRNKEISNQEERKHTTKLLAVLQSPPILATLLHPYYKVLLSLVSLYLHIVINFTIHGLH